MFVLNHRHVEAICDGLISMQTEVKDLNIWAYSRIDTVECGITAKASPSWFQMVGFRNRGRQRHRARRERKATAQ